ncbi:uncharacterized protein [Venturia canescens]|uniref:uncharacterized protein n=1 Tax=Venturia canescens TaxID=32260 RepID=UPI001C9CE13E|nr:uncharacterized protein LOC122418413 [Venturia canescens]
MRLLVCLMLVCTAFAEEAKTVEKRGLGLSLGYGGYGGLAGLGAYGDYGYGHGLSAVHTVEKTVAVPVAVPKPYPVPVDRPYPVKVPVAVPHAVPVAVPVPQPYPVIKTKTVAVPVDRPYPVKVPVKVPYPVPAPYPVKVAVPHPVPVAVPQPVVVKETVPVYVKGHESYGHGLYGGDYGHYATNFCQTSRPPQFCTFRSSTAFLPLSHDFVRQGAFSYRSQPIKEGSSRDSSQFQTVTSICIMLTKTIVALTLVAMVCAGPTPGETKTKNADKVSGPKHEKRGVLDLGYGFGPSASSYSSDFGFSSLDLGQEVHSTHVITKEVGVPVPHPVAVPVDRPVPYAVKVPYAVPVDRPYPVSVPKPYPVEVTKHVAVPVDRPVPVPYGVPYKVAVPAPYPVHVPQPYAVPIVKHVAVPVSQPLVVEKYSSGWSGLKSSW